MIKCALLLAATLSVGASHQEFTLLTNEDQICVEGGAVDAKCYDRPSRLAGEYDLRTALQLFDDNYDENFRLKNRDFIRPETDQVAAGRSIAPALGISFGERRFLLGSFAQLKYRQAGIEKAKSRVIMSETGVKFLEIPFVISVQYARSEHPNNPEETSFRGRLELPADLPEQVAEKSVGDPREFSRYLANMVEIDEQSNSGLSEDERDSIAAAVVAQAYAENYFDPM